MPKSHVFHEQVSIDSVLKSAGFDTINKITDTLQGSIWRGSYQTLDGKTDSVAIKVTNKYLQQHSLAIFDNKSTSVQENILYEAAILKYLTDDDKCPQSIIKYHQLYQT